MEFCFLIFVTSIILKIEIHAKLIFKNETLDFMKSLFVSFWLFAASEPSAPRGQSRGDTPPETTMSDENDDEFEDNMNQMVHIYIVFHFPGASVHQRILLAIICFPS